MRLILALALVATADSVGAVPRPLSQIDYAGFQFLTGDVAAHRDSRLISWDAFIRAGKAPGALILDARSADAYAAGHIAGAVNLPFTDFTAASLKQVIGNSDRPIFIYCNNNFVNDAAPVMLKLRPLALNIQTFINLVGYGYRNVYELREAVDFNDPAVGWVKGEAAIQRAAVRDQLLAQPSGG